MAMQFEVSAGGSSVPAGMYKATFKAAEPTEPHAEYGRGVRFEFSISGGGDGSQDGQTATVICGMEKPASPKNRLGKILGGIAGSPVQPGQTISIEQFIGKTYLIVVEQAPSGTGTRISTVMPSI